MATHIVGVRKPAPLGSLAATQKTTIKQLTPVTTGTFAVVTNALAARMQGWQSNKSKTGNGTCFAIFNTMQKAQAYQAAKKLQLRTTIVQW